MIGCGKPDQLFFMHIPKTAGTSFRLFLESFFSRRFPSDELMAQHGHFYPPLATVLAISDQEFNRYDLYAGHYPLRLLEKFTTPPAVLTIIRHPWERLISHLRHDHGLVQRGEYVPQCPRLRRHLESGSIEDLLLDEQCEFYLRQRCDLQMRMFSCRQEIDLQSLPLLTEAEAEQAWQKLPDVQFLGVTEETAGFAAMVQSEMGPGVEASLGRYNVSERRMGSDCLSAAAKARIESLCCRELEFWQFAGSIFQRRLKSAARRSFRAA